MSYLNGEIGVQILILIFCLNTDLNILSNNINIFIGWAKIYNYEKLFLIKEL